MRGEKVLVLGLSCKKDIDDPRESPSFKVVELWLAKGAKVVYNDPFFPTPPAEPVRLTEAALAEQDAFVIVTGHGAYDYAWIVEHGRRVVDTRNATNDVAKGREKIARA